MRALVIFDDESTHWLAPLLTRGCRHVSCLVQHRDREDCWVHLDLTIDAGFVAQTVGGDEDSLINHYSRQGLRVLAIDVDPGKRQLLLPFMPNNCVALTKAALGIGGFSITPHQLMKQLIKRFDNEAPPDIPRRRSIWQFIPGRPTPAA